MIFTRDRCLYTFLASCTDSRLIRSFNSLGSFDDGLFDFPCGRTCGPSCNRPARAPCARARRSVNFSCAIPHAPTRGSHAVAPRGGGGHGGMDARREGGRRVGLGRGRGRTAGGLAGTRDQHRGGSLILVGFCRSARRLVRCMGVREGFGIPRCGGTGWPSPAASRRSHTARPVLSPDHAA